MRITLIILLYIITQTVISQPAPVGGKFYFSVLVDSNQILHKESGLNAWPEFDSNSAIIDFEKETIFWENDSTLGYELMPAPLGPYFPKGFILVMSYRDDTMRISGLSGRGAFLALDNIPFIKGNYHIPEEVIPFMDMQWKSGINFTSLDWQNFKVINTDKIAYAVLEGIDSPSFSKDTSQYQRFKTTYINGKNAVLKFDSIRNNWDTLFQNIGTYNIKVIGNSKKTLITLGRSAILYSENGSKDWSLFFFKEPASVRTIKLHPFKIDSIWISGDDIFIKADRFYSSYYNFRESLNDSVFKVHFNLPEESDLYQKIKMNNEEEISFNVIPYIHELVDERSKSTRKLYKERYPERLKFNLKKGEYVSPYINHVILDLNKGEFKYRGTNQLYADYANYNSEGTYSYNDSTITFFESPEYQNIEYDSSNIDFAPRGTYYWYTTDNGALILTQYKFHESMVSYNYYHAFFKRKE